MAALEEYRRKRNFRRTTEPRGRASGPRTRRRAARGARRGLRFVVQKHAASRLHYDFRLELDGVLKSWAVPKGPSLVPAERRLAVEVEDHPLEYGDFEGTIPEGEYGGGSVLLWDRGVWIPKGDPNEGLRKGRLAFELEGEKLRGAWRLVRMRSEDGGKTPWLLMKERDAFARNGFSRDLVDERPESVVTGRRIEEIGIGAKPDRRWSSSRPTSREVARERPPGTRVPPKPTRKGPPKRDPRRRVPVREPPAEDPPKPPVREPPDEVRERLGVRVRSTGQRRDQGTASSLEDSRSPPYQNVCDARIPGPRWNGITQTLTVAALRKAISGRV